MAQKKKSDTVTAESDMARAAPPEPPEHVYLREGDRPYWDSVVRARDYNAWTTADLEQAANLARCKSDIDRLSREITEEGDTVLNQRGTPVVNPKHSLLETLSRRAVALSRMLHVHAEATEGESRHQGKRSEKQRSLADATEKSQDDGLIPKPVH